MERTDFTKVFVVNDENQLLGKLNNIFVQEAPTIVTGYNIDNYDLPWIIKRGTAKSRTWGKNYFRGVSIRKKSLDSSGLGKTIPGIQPPTVSSCSTCTRT